MKTIHPKYNLGQRVLIGPDFDIPAIVTQINVGGNYHLTYQCIWMAERVRNSAWLHEEEIQPKCSDKPKELMIGFKNDDQTASD